MPKFPQGGRVRVSTSAPPLFESQRPVSSETKYYGLIRDNALVDIEEPSEALSEVLRDIQDPAEAATIGLFTAPDLQIIDGIRKFDLKFEDFEIVKNSSIDVSSGGALVPQVNPRQRISDRIKRIENFAGRGTVYQGQGSTLFKYVVPTDAEDGSDVLYSHTNPPPFFTENITTDGSTLLENAPDYIPALLDLEDTHRVGIISDGVFVPDKEPEYWWAGAYLHDMRGAEGRYGEPSNSALIDPKYPIIRDGNLNFGEVPISGIGQSDNWGLRFDTWLKRDFNNDDTFMRFAAQVNGQLRIDYFEKTGYNASGEIQGTWKKALDTTSASTYYVQDSKEEPVPASELGYRRYFIQGGPSTGLGEGTGVAHVTRTTTNGGAWDLTATYNDKESNSVDTFDNDYVPVIIRFWYGQKDTTTSSDNINEIDRAPLGSPGFVLDMITTDTDSTTLDSWNDYSAQIEVTWNGVDEFWEVSDGDDSDFSNFNDVFEVVGWSEGTVKPDSIEDYFSSSILITGSKNSDSQISFDIPGVTSSGTYWVILRNRPWNVVPGGRGKEELWQRYLFNPDTLGSYANAEDLLDGIGSNYVEPDPSKEVFDLNYGFYKAKYGVLPALNTYGPDRYDGFVPTTLTTSSGSRDYDYDHNKLLMIGRQKKDAAIKPLQSGETRNSGENYTFIEVVKNEAGFGGNVIINAYPTNNLSVLTTSETGQFGKFLHMGDNSETFSNSARQNLSVPSLKYFPVSGFGTTAAVTYKVTATGAIYLYLTNQDGTVYDISGVIADNDLGTGGDPEHDTKSVFIVEYEDDNNDVYSFYGFIGSVRDSQEDVELTTESGSALEISNAEIFPNLIGANSYTGTVIKFKSGGSITTELTGRVASFDSATNTVTYTLDSGSLDVSTSYIVDVWYNHLTVPSWPSKVVDKTTGLEASPQPSVSDGDQIKITYVNSSGYQFSRADSGAGINFSETLFIKENALATQSRPFSDDTEAPRPPADIVTPFGYDNSPSNPTDPGLGGLCYPPYTIQDTTLLYLAVNDSDLYSSTKGNFDLYWGGRNVSLTNLGNKSLTVTDKLLFDFDVDDRGDLISSLTNAQKPAFTGSEYTHKLEVELNVEVKEGTASNSNLYADVIKHSDGSGVKDKFYLFINQSGSNLQLLTANNPDWSLVES